jgi:protocatechuate 3,4-dioxygenase alpha subunit
MSAPKKPLPESPSQTAGPYVHIGCMPIFSGIEGLYPEDPGSRMIAAETRGERIAIRGRIFDGDGEPVRDAVIEIWQADAAGIHASAEDPRGAADPNFRGWGRTACDFDTGEYRFETVKPGAVPYPDGRLQAPHITFWVVARGINIGLHTRLYFGDESEANVGDPILSSIEPRARAETLIAAAGGEGCYGFDIYLQGPRETVFLDI